MELHIETNSLLRKVASSADFPHLIIYGPTGAGKKTRALAVIRELFGPGAEKVTVGSKELSGPSSKFTVALVSSSYHLEIAPGDLGNKDAIVVQTLIKEAAQTPPPISSGRPFKVVLITDADCLSKQAQAALRRTMEKYISACRIILVTDSLSKLIPPIRSRCLCVRVQAPTETEIGQVLQNACVYDNIRGNFPLEEISRSCDRDLRRALLMLDAARLSARPAVIRPPWEEFTEEISRDILHEQTPKKLLEVRGKLYDLLSSCIPGEEILRKLVNSLADASQERKAMELISLASKFEHSMRLGSKEIFHLEAFCAKAMAAIRLGA